MRAGLSTIQQTLTPEAASVLNKSIAEAARRGHNQTTPLHVAATLLASPAGLFRQACVRSHPNSSHPLQCRALELCFSVALDRLPSSGPPLPNSNPHSSSSSSALGGCCNGLEQPPISNALMAALKRAQAHQRRGCPEQQQQPLLAIKVELEQLIVSILDDPGVSRVMREASFSSPAVKATIQQTVSASTPSPAAADSSFSTSLASASVDSRSFGSCASVGKQGGLRPSLTTPGAPLLPGNKNLYLNPRLQLQQSSQQPKGGIVGVGRRFDQHIREELKRVFDILQRTKKRNPVLVSDCEPETIVREALQRIQRGEIREGPLQNAEVISLEKELGPDRSMIPLKLKELRSSIELRLKSKVPKDARGVILDLGDLKWLVESPGSGTGGATSAPIPQQQKVVLEVGRIAVAEMTKLLASLADSGDDGQIWLIGTATCATYLRCQVYHPTMESDWDLQAVPITAAAPLPGDMLPRINGGGKGILSSSVESLSIQKGFPAVGATAAAIPSRHSSEVSEPCRIPMCRICTDGYERELAKLVGDEFEKSSAESESESEPRQPLPPWLQLANPGNAIAKPAVTQLQVMDQDPRRKRRVEELLKRWIETCSRLHRGAPQEVYHGKPVTPLLPVPMPSMHDASLCLQRHNSTLKPQSELGCSHILASEQNGAPGTASPVRTASPPGSPVRTDLVLGRAKLPPTEKSTENTAHRERLQDPVGCMPDILSKRRGDRAAGNLDLDSFKRLIKGLTEKVSWQPEAASLVAATVIQCKSGGSKRREASGRGDTWLLFMGPDKVGKKKMAVALSELVAGGSPVVVSFGGSKANADNLSPSTGSRGKTALDRVTEVVRRNPFSVVVLEDVDHASVLVQGSLRRAMERGRLPDSHGREIALGSVIFILIAQTLPDSLQSSMNEFMQCEEKLSSAVCSSLQVELMVCGSPGNRRARWMREEEDADSKPKKRALAAGAALSLDLNLAAGSTDNVATAECSPNSSDLTVENEHNEWVRPRLPNGFASPSISELARAVDEAVVFKPVDFGELRRKVYDAITRRFRSVFPDGRCLRLDNETLDWLVAGVWFGEMPAAMFDDWTEKVLVPSFQQLRRRSATDVSPVVRLLAVENGSTPLGGIGAGATTWEWLPREVAVAMDGP